MGIEVASDLSPLLQTTDRKSLVRLDNFEGLAELESAMLEWTAGSNFDRMRQMVHDHLQAGGKRLRARLAFAAYEAFGGSRREIVGFAAACELIHNATLIHDDVQDGDVLRRNHPTTWICHGRAQAINAGDLLLMLPFLVVGKLQCNDTIRWQLCQTIARQAEITVRGQALELDLLSNGQIDWDSYARAAEGKSGALLALPVEGAALLAGFSEELAREFGKPFSRLGLLYQLYDDVLDLFGDKGRGRSGQDLEEGKVSACVIEHLRLFPNEQNELIELLQLPRNETPLPRILLTIERFRTGGALALVVGRMEKMEAEILDAAIWKVAPQLRDVVNELILQLKKTVKVS